MIVRPFANACETCSRSAMPRATWYANTNPNQIASWSRKSSGPRGKMPSMRLRIVEL